MDNNGRQTEVDKCRLRWLVITVVGDYDDVTTTSNGDATAIMLDTNFATMANIDALDVSSALMADGNATAITLDASSK